MEQNENEYRSSHPVDVLFRRVRELEAQNALLSRGMAFYSRNIDKSASTGELLTYTPLRDFDHGEMAKFLAEDRSMPMPADFTKRFLNIGIGGGGGIVYGAEGGGRIGNGLRDVAIFVDGCSKFERTSFTGCVIHLHFLMHASDQFSDTAKLVFGSDVDELRFSKCTITDPFSRERDLVHAKLYNKHLVKFHELKSRFRICDADAPHIPVASGRS